MRLTPALSTAIEPFPLFHNGSNTPRSMLDLMPVDWVFRANWELSFARHREQSAALLDLLKRTTAVPAMVMDHDGALAGVAARSARPELIEGDAEPFAYYGAPPRAELRRVQ